MLSDIASITTLILFVLYFIGRFIAIIRNRSIFPDKIIMESIDFNQGEFDIVETFEMEENPQNIFVLTSEQGIYHVSVYQILYDNKLNRIGRKKLEKFKWKFLNKGQSLCFCITSPELLTTYEVEYFTPDYRKVTIDLWDNPKNGVMSESAVPKNTIKSILYYLVK